MNYKVLIVTLFFLKIYAQDAKCNLQYNIVFDTNDSYNVKFISEIKSKQNIDTLKLFVNNNSTVEFKILYPLNLNIKISDSLFGKKILIFSNKESEIFKQVSLSYILKIPDDIKTRNFFSDDNQLYLLPDLEYIPSILNNDNIQYNFSIKKNNKFSYIDEDFKIEKTKIPYVLMGNFYLKNVNKIETLIPKNINYDDDKLLSILKIVDSSYKFFSKIYGIPNKKEKFKVFFLNRSGGHAHTSGLILDQKYLIDDSKLSNRTKLLISHEVAHYWWGINVDSFQSSLFEGLSEYSALLYMEEIEKVNIKDFYVDKNIQLELNPLDKIKFDTITPYNDNFYRTFSYSKLPLIFIEIENEIGREKMLIKLKNLFFKFNSINKKISYDDFIRNFEMPNVENELMANLLGLDEFWKDYYIKSVNDSVVTYGVESLSNKENILVHLTNLDNKIIADTISFDNKINEVVRSYNFKVKRVEIDPNFINSQINILNDVFDSNNVNTSNSKIGKIYESEYYILADRVVKYLFYDQIDINTFVLNDELQSKLKEIANSTRKIKVNGFLLFIDKKKNNMKIKVNFSSSTKKSISGYLEFTYIETIDGVYLKSINRIKL